MQHIDMFEVLSTFQHTLCNKISRGQWDRGYFHKYIDSITVLMDVIIIIF